MPEYGDGKILPNENLDTAALCSGKCRWPVIWADKIIVGDTRDSSERVTKPFTISASNITYIYPDTYWEDLRFPFTQTRQGALLTPTFDTTNVGLLFPKDDTSEVTYCIAQFPHGYVRGSQIHPHIHWQQNQADFPNWVCEYKIINSGGVVPSSFTKIETNTGLFAYASGSIQQLSSFPAVTGPDGLSGLMLCKIYRDDDVVAGDVLAFEFDIHVQMNAPGSGLEFTK